MTGAVPVEVAECSPGHSKPYPVVLLDTISFKCPTAWEEDKAAPMAVGVDVEGRKEALGSWLGPPSLGSG